VNQRAAYADVTVHLGDGKRMIMRVDSPRLEVEQDYGDVYAGSFGDPRLTRSLSPMRTVRIEGYLGDAVRHETPEAPLPAKHAPKPATAWEDPAADPIADLRHWRERWMQGMAPAADQPAAATPGAEPVPDLADLPGLADLGTV
jgi:hypothetical protein